MKYKDLFDLKGKVAVVTGGLGLLGKELVCGLSEFGAAVVVADVKRNAIKAIDKKKKADNISYFVSDTTKENTVLSLIKSTHKKYGRIDIWVNSAYPRTKDWGNKFENISLVSWKKNVDKHLSGYFICSQKIAEYMKRQKSGSIINIASIYGFMAPDFSVYEGTNMTMPAAYSAIKGGIINFSRYLASYYGSENVRVNCISPGGIFNNQPQAFVEKYGNKAVIKRMANNTDMTGAVIFLASDASGYVTGHNLVVDGGFSI